MEGFTWGRAYLRLADIACIFIFPQSLLSYQITLALFLVIAIPSKRNNTMANNGMANKPGSLIRLYKGDES